MKRICVDKTKHDVALPCKGCFVVLFRSLHAGGSYRSVSQHPIGTFCRNYWGILHAICRRHLYHHRSMELHIGWRCVVQAFEGHGHVLICSSNLALQCRVLLLICQYIFSSFCQSGLTLYPRYCEYSRGIARQDSMIQEYHIQSLPPLLKRNYTSHSLHSFSIY